MIIQNLNSNLKFELIRSDIVWNLWIGLEGNKWDSVSLVKRFCFGQVVKTIWVEEIVNGLWIILLN